MSAQTWLRRLRLYGSYLKNDSLRNNCFRLRYHVPVWHGENWRASMTVSHARRLKDAALCPKKRVAVLLSGEGQQAERDLEKQTVPPALVTGKAEETRGFPICLHVRRDMALSPQLVARVTAAAGKGKGKQVIYADELYADQGQLRPCLKPQWCPETFEQADYIGPCYATVGIDAAWPLKKALEEAEQVTRIPKALTSVERAAEEDPAPPWHIHPVQRPLPAGKPLVSILMPTRDHVDMLRRCVESICRRTNWAYWELLLIDNGSTQKKTLAYFDQLSDPRIRVLHRPGPFNYARLNNDAAREAKGDYLLLMNNDMEVLDSGWMEALLRYAAAPGIGAVGGLLTYPDGTIQHAGIALKMAYRAGHIFRGHRADEAGYQHWISLARNVSAVTGACLMVRREAWESVGGMDEALAVAYNDVDFCLRLGQAGLRCVYTPACRVMHDESRSRGGDDSGAKQKRFRKEARLFERKWGKVLRQGDPCMNPGFCFDGEEIGFR